MLDDSSLRSMKFTVILTPAHLFLNGLMAMRMMASSAALIVKNGAVQVLAFSQDRKVISTLVMEASTDFSLSSTGFAIQFHLLTWIQLLLPPIFQQPLDSIRIFKISESSDLHCIAGQDSVPIRLSEAIFVQEHGIDIKSLNTHCVALSLRTECFREVMTAFAFTYSHVLMTAFKDKVSFSRNVTESGILTYETENGDCSIRGVEPSTAGCLLIEWREAHALSNAAKLTEHVMIFPLFDEEWMDWILFFFIIDEMNFFTFMMQGSDAQIIDP